jgi:hypothetical protein
MKFRRRLVSLIALAIVGLASWGRWQISAAPAGAIHYPDLRVDVPIDSFSILQTSPTTREFRYTHIQNNVGDGPFEVRLTYDPTSDLSRGAQRLYTHDASNNWILVSEIPTTPIFQFHAIHGHHHVPFAKFGLYEVAPDGSVGAPVAVSPKVGFCIADSLTVATLPHQGALGYGWEECGKPDGTVGISVGMGDFYDFHDDGQSVPADGLANGTYWFHAVADPYNYFIEKDETNNITDILVQVSGNTVTVVAGPFFPNSQPPTVFLTSPATGAVAGSGVVLTASASDASGIDNIQYFLDGLPIGSPVSVPPYSMVWDSRVVPDGVHDLSAQAQAGSGLYGTTLPTVVTVANNPPPPPPGPLAISNVLVMNRTTSSATISWTTTQPATSRVNYGLTSQYLSAPVIDPQLVTSHAVTLSGLAANTTYHYQVVSENSTGVTAAGDFIFTTAGVTTISCTLTAPAPGSTVSQTVKVAANAFGTAAIIGVQFLLDGSPLGAEVTHLPHEVNWITSSMPNGSHQLSAIARNPTGNQAVCPPVTVTVENATSTAGLVAAYGFNESNGTVAMDASGSANNGTVSGAAWTTAGKFGAALAFDGVNDLVTVNDAANLDLTTDLTLEAWVYSTAASGWRTAILKETPTGLAYALYAHDNAPQPAAYLSIDGDQSVAGTAVLASNTWSHLAATYDGSAIRLYVNGQLVGTRPTSGAVAVSSGLLRIGGNGVWGEYFSGRLDEIRIWDHARTPAQIQLDMKTPIGAVVATAPGPPTNASAVAGDGQAIVSFSAPESDGGAAITSYSVITFLGGNPHGSAVSGTASPLTVTGLSNGSTYTFTVSANNSVGSGPPSAPTAPVTPLAAPTTPGAPTGVSGTGGNALATVSWTAPASNGGSAITGYRVQVATASGGPFSNAAGCPTTSTTPSCVATGLSNGTGYFFRVAAINVVGTGPFSVVSAAVTPTGGTGGTVVTADSPVWSDGLGSRTLSLTTAGARLVVAFVASDGPASGGQTLSVSGGGLTWTLVRRVNTRLGSSEIWRAFSATALTNANISLTQSSTGFYQSLTVVAFAGATGVGASNTAHGASGAPQVSVTTTRANSLVYGVGNDWDRAVARTVVAGQTKVHEYLPSVGDTLWVQAITGAVPGAGTVVTLRDSAPTNDRWNFAAVEVIP